MYLLLCAGVMVNFVPTEYSEMEGDDVQITAMLDIPADRVVTVDFTTNPGTAGGKFCCY